MSKWVYAPSWTPSFPPTAKDGTSPEVCIVFGRGGSGRALLKYLEATGHKTFFVAPGDDFSANADGSYSVNPSLKDDYVKLFSAVLASGASRAFIAHAWLLEDDAGDDGEGASERDLKLGYYSLLSMTQALDETGDAGRVSAVAVTRGVFDVTGREDISPARGAVLGPVLTAPGEFPGLVFRLVDVDSVESAGPDIVHEIIHGQERSIAIRDGRRWAQTYVPTPLSSKSGLELRENGVYVITGGLGEIGHALAVRMAKSAPVNLALIVRSPLPPSEQWASYTENRPHDDPVSKKIARVMQIEKLAGRTLVIATDMGDAKAVADAFGKVEKELGAINGVIHCAGETGDISLRTLAQTDFQTSQTHFGAKARGAVAIEKALRGKQFDFCVLMSSLACVLGGVGFTAYSGANAYMDSVAVKAGRKSSARWITINWDGWRHSAGKTWNGTMSPSVGALLIGMDEGIDLLFRMLADPKATRMAVCVVNLAEREETLARARKAAGKTLHARQTSADPKSNTHPPRNSMEKILADMWTNLLGVETLGIHDDFFELGGHSLLATQVISRIKKEFNVDCSPTAIFQSPTVAKMAETISMMALAEKLGAIENGEMVATREEIEL
jgi:NAD(P)-dependent dehydrogenase (short-subunit alcohol dehydrogenase family)/acyl carrier protein